MSNSTARKDIEKDFIWNVFPLLRKKLKHKRYVFCGYTQTVCVNKKREHIYVYNMWIIKSFRAHHYDCECPYCRSVR